MAEWSPPRIELPDTLNPIRYIVLVMQSKVLFSFISFFQKLPVGRVALSVLGEERIETIHYHRYSCNELVSIRPDKHGATRPSCKNILSPAMLSSVARHSGNFQIPQPCGSRDDRESTRQWDYVQPRCLRLWTQWAARFVRQDLRKLSLFQRGS